MNIIQQPSTYNFAGNIADIVLTGESSVTFSIPLLLEEVYYPDADGRITIPLRAFFEAHLHAAGVDEIPDEGSPLTAYTYYINGAEAGNFYVLPGGVAAQSIDTPLFLKSNFLTWQPQTRRVSYHEPQWLRYVAIHVCTAKVKGYFASGDPVTVTLKEMTAGRLYCLDMNYGRIRGLFEKQPVYYDVWVESDDGRLSFVQRYVLREEDSDSADYFVFENSLGGYDTIRFTGDRKEVGESESRNAVFDGDTFEYGIDYGKSWTKYTGYLPNERVRTWVLEFFSSCRRYHLADSSLERIYVSKPKLEATAGEASGYEFSFAYTHQSRYLNIARDELPEQLEIVGPGAELFFLAPRLNEFPLLDIEQDILIPAQYPYTEKWGVLSLAALLAIVQSDNSGSIGTIYHDQLKNLDLANQHPIKAISGLQTALEQKVSLSVYNTFVSTYNNHVNSPSHLNAKQQSILSRFSVVDGRLQIEGDVYTTGLLSQLGSGEEGEDTGALSLGSLTNVGAWADAVGDEDVLLYRPKGSSVWGMKRLSEIMAGGGGGGTVYHDQLEHLDYPDQHPIVAIAGLQSALDAKANSSLLAGAILGKGWDSSLNTTEVGTGFQRLSEGSSTVGPYISFGHSGYIAQLTVGYTDYSGYSDMLRYRVRNGESSTWTDWKTIWHSGNSNLSAVDWSGKILRAYQGVRTQEDYGINLLMDNMNASGVPNYGIFFGGTSKYGTHGDVTSDSATYLTMAGYNDSTHNHRGWIFRVPTLNKNVASISSSGSMTLNGNLVVNGTSINIAGNSVWHSGNDGANSGLDADLLDGRHASEFWGNFLTPIDASTLSEDYYYPVTIYVAYRNRVRIGVMVDLDSKTKPSWSTHANGFACRFIEEVSGDGWGAIAKSRVVLDSTYKWANKNPIGKVDQMTNTNHEVIWVRGGGKYYFYTSQALTITLRTSSFTGGGQTVSPILVSSVNPEPHKSGDGLIGVSTVYCNSIVIGGHTISWDSGNNAFKIDGNVYTTGSITQLKS